MADSHKSAKIAVCPSGTIMSSASVSATARAILEKEGVGELAEILRIDCEVDVLDTLTRCAARRHSPTLLPSVT